MGKLPHEIVIGFQAFPCEVDQIVKINRAEQTQAVLICLVDVNANLEQGRNSTGLLNGCQIGGQIAEVFGRPDETVRKVVHQGRQAPFVFPQSLYLLPG